MASSSAPTVQNPPERRPGALTIVLVSLWGLWALLLAGAMMLGNLGAGHGSAPATALRMGSSLALVIVAWLAWGAFRGRAAQRFALAIALGMTLGAIGDFFNAGLLDFAGLSNPVLGGIAAFGLGHIAYIAGCVDLARLARLTQFRAQVAAIAAWQLFGVAAWYVVVYLGSENRELIWPALAYTLLLAGTAGIASGLALQDRRLAPLAVGAILFLVSDLVLAVGLFRGHFPYQSECVWLTYGPGQMLIVFSTISAAVVLSPRRLGLSPTAV